MNKPSTIPGIIWTALGIFFCILTFWGWAWIILGVIIVVIGAVVWSSEASELKIYNLKMEILQRQGEFLKSIDFTYDIKIPIDAYKSFYINKDKGVYYFTPNMAQYCANQAAGFVLRKLDSIVEIKVSENNNLVIESSGGTGGALVGGMLFGATGAIIGATGKNVSSHTNINELSINIVTDDIANAYVKVAILDNPVQNMSPFHKMVADAVEKIYSALRSFLSTKPGATETQPETTGTADEILRFKNLLDNGAITQEEFDAKKKQLLGL